ncbi:MAG: hypothetical protein J6Y29_07215, partial [Clostridiales bacterium]|nr:hypothetical protein [Clostridiales bacterium]
MIKDIFCNNIGSCGEVYRCLRSNNKALTMLIILLLSSFFMPFFSREIYASPYTPGTLGICTIANPEFRSDGDNTITDASIYNRVYFGWIPDNPSGRAINCINDGTVNIINPYSGAYNRPIFWRVLQTEANDVNKTKALFMLMEYGLNYISWDMRHQSNTSNPGNQRWNRGNTTDSSLRKFLQGSSCALSLTNNVINGTAVDPCGNSGTSFYDECFDIVEQNTILETINNERDNYLKEGGAQNVLECTASYGPTGADRPYAYMEKGKLAGDTSSNVYKKNTKACIYCGCSLNGDKIFLLSVKESLNKAYGFSDAYDYFLSSNGRYRQRQDVNRRTRMLSTPTASNTRWWLRSAYSYDRFSVVGVIDSGTVDRTTTDNDSTCVRCALNIPLSSVLMTSSANNTSSTPAITQSSDVAKLTPMPNSSLNPSNPAYIVRTKFLYGNNNSNVTILDTTGNDATETINTEVDNIPTSIENTYSSGAKLTIVDDSMQFSLTNPSPNSTVNVYSGYKITISYSGAKNTYGTENVTGYISAIIKSGAYNSTDNNTSLCAALPLYYARLKTVDTEGNGSVSIQLPDLAAGDYTLIIYNEIERGPYKTNYAKPQMLTLSVQYTPGALGICTIGNPTYYDSANIGKNAVLSAQKLASEYNRVYFGMTDSSNSYDIQYVKNKPIYWRTLNTTANDDIKTPALFMLTEYCVTPDYIFDETSQLWQNSLIKSYLHNEILPSFFSQQEQLSIMSTAKTTSDDQEGDIKLYNDGLSLVAYGCKLTGDKLFLLSAQEQINKSYGFSDFQNIYKTYNTTCINTKDTNKLSKHYASESNVNNILSRLRSAYSRYPDYTAAIIDNEIRTLKISDTSPVRFALNIPLSSILMTTEATDLGSIPSFTFSTISSSLPRTIIAYDVDNISNPETIITVGNTTTTEIATVTSSPSGAKLTIVDDSMQFSLTNPSPNSTVNVYSGNKITISYSGAKNTYGTEN